MAKKKKKSGGESKKKESETAFGLAIPELKVDEKLAKMSVEEAIREEGILPFNPVEIGTDDVAEQLGQQAGAVYGASLFALIKAFTRTDLPLNKRVRVGVKGVRPLLSMMLQATDTYHRFSAIENAILQGEPIEAGGRKVAERAPTAHEVIRDLQQRIERIEQENKELRAALQEKKEKRKGEESEQ